MLDTLIDPAHIPDISLFKGVQYPWEVIAKLADYMTDTVVGNVSGATIHPLAFVAEDVFLGEGTVVEPGAVIYGPTRIGKNCVVQAGAYIRGNVWIGDNVRVGHATEVKNAVMLDSSQASHFNYVGDSILGYKAHLAGGAALANKKLSDGTVSVSWSDKKIDTGLAKFGAVIGDGADIGANTITNPGAIIGKNSVIYPLVSWRGELAANMIAKSATNIVPRNPNL